ncbi:MAG: efflux RND transporter periplasmic adaptor subunit [Acidobacteria bacterium]|nr:efflux RND transporter periplasmic adaptor subunit [Acidobacteriota bacterium]
MSLRLRIGLISLIGLMLFAGCRRGGNQAAKAPPPALSLGAEDTALVMKAPIQSGPAVTGTLAAKTQATIRSQLAGSVLETYAQPGQPVRRSQVLARLDTTSLTDAYTSAQAAVESARTSLAVAEREAQRQKTLEAAGAVAQRNVETAQQSVVAAQATLAQARAQLANAAKQLGNARVTAPFAGVVSERPVSPGDVVQAGTALFTVLDPSILQLEAAVPAEQLAVLRVGSPIEFNVTGYAGRAFRGSITRINPSADPATRQVRIYAEIPNPGGALVAGLYAEGRVESESRTALTLPLGAIDRRMAKPAVLRVRDGKVERVEVELGLEDDRDQRVEVRRGVAAGDVVLVGGAQEIAPGTPVRLAPSVQQQAERLGQAL